MAKLDLTTCHLTTLYLAPHNCHPSDFLKINRVTNLHGRGSGAGSPERRRIGLEPHASLLPRARVGIGMPLERVLLFGRHRQYSRAGSGFVATLLADRMQGLPAPHYVPHRPGRGVGFDRHLIGVGQGDAVARVQKRRSTHSQKKKVLFPYKKYGGKVLPDGQHWYRLHVQDPGQLV